MLVATANAFSLNARTQTADSTDSQLPSKNKNVYTPEQDSAFRAALDLQIPFSLRSRLDLELSEPLWMIAQRNIERNPWVSAMNSLSSLPEGIYAPSGVDIVNWETNIVNSMYVPFVRTYSTYGGKIPLKTIAGFLGLVEDVSPVIKYTLGIQADVEVVVYSVQATVVATLFKGVQSPGAYTINWNGRDDEGRKMSSGDYIAEVRIGTDRYVRKRIVIKQ